MTLKEFEGLSAEKMCELMNSHMENHTARNFKSGEMGFTFQQAEKALSQKGVYKISGVYRTEDEALSYLEEKKRERNKKVLSQEDIEHLLKLLEPETYNNLIRLASKYDYVSSYILKENRGINIKSGDSSDIHSTSFRVYRDTNERWKTFVKENRAYSALDLLNTALIEFMDRHSY